MANGLKTGLLLVVLTSILVGVGTVAGAVMLLASFARFGALPGGMGRDRRGGVFGLLDVSLVAP